MKTRVLVVDDKPNFRALFRRILLPEEFDVSTAPDSATALAILAQQPVDVLVSDVKMPGPDGIELLRQVKAAYPDIRVILMTAFGAVPDAVAALRSGAFHYITKPFEPDQVIEVIRQSLHDRPVTESSEPSVPHESADDPIAIDPLANDDATRLTGEEAPPSGVDSSESPEISRLAYREALAQSRDRTSKDYLRALLVAVRGNVTQAAERAGVERESLHRLLKKYGLRAEDFRGK